MRKEITAFLIIIIIITQFMIGIIGGLAIGTLRHEETRLFFINRAKAKPQSIAGYVVYPFKIGERTGIILTKPRFNLEQ
jgi:hypothetical protein